ncbi:MAG: C4-dicarboxylate transporter DcuC [Burkholderiales bacterium]|nr:C4-dicarboxylate transporter DcuC [Burkholderiales bacterium]
MSLPACIAVVDILVTIYCLIKRYETRLVLFTAGMFLCCITLSPMEGLNQFAKSMTNAALIQAICGAMGFAYVITKTGCDKHLVTALARPLKGIGIFLIPAATLVTFFINIAIPTAAGCAAAVGTTFIPVMIRAGIRPAAAGAAVLMGTYGSVVAPGLSHNAFVANLANMEIMDLIFLHSTYSFLVMLIGLVGITIVSFVLKDNKPTPAEMEAYEKATGGTGDITKVNPLKAFAPLIPLVILVLGNTIVPAIKMGVAQAMVIGAIYTLLVTLVNPQDFTKQFFKGAGDGYANILGIIIAAGVFAAGLKVSGLIDAFIAMLKQSSDIARWGASLGPFIMAVVSGTGDAATLAFNEAVTPHAAEFGMTIPKLGSLALISGGLGRTMSPIAGVTIVVAGLCASSPLSLCKRTAVPMIVAVIVLALVMV